MRHTFTQLHVGDAFKTTVAHTDCQILPSCVGAKFATLFPHRGKCLAHHITALLWVVQYAIGHDQQIAIMFAKYVFKRGHLLIISTTPPLYPHKCSIFIGDGLFFAIFNALLTIGGKEPSPIRHLAKITRNSDWLDEGIVVILQA